MPLRRLLDHKPLRTFPGQWWFVAFLAIGLMSSLVVQVPAVIFLSGAFVMVKGLLLAWAVAQLDWSERHIRCAVRAAAGVILFALRRGGREPGDAVGVERGPRERQQRGRAPQSVLPSLIGPFTHPIDLGQFMSLSALAIAAWRSSVRKSAFTLGLLVATAAAARADRAPHGSGEPLGGMAVAAADGALGAGARGPRGLSADRDRLVGGPRGPMSHR